VFIFENGIINLHACRFIEPTILVDPPLQAAIMTEEIFGPLLPIITVRDT
jgi:acyl-CoA reductase-like NAD-dependent aldehyde dehydrogenase